MSYYMSTSMRNRVVEVVTTSICTALVLWSMNRAYWGIDQKFKDQNDRSDRIEKSIEKKVGSYITKDDFNVLLEAKLKQFKVTKEGRLIVAP